MWYEGHWDSRKISVTTATNPGLSATRTINMQLHFCNSYLVRGCRAQYQQAATQCCWARRASPPPASLAQTWCRKRHLTMDLCYLSARARRQNGKGGSKHKNWHNNLKSKSEWKEEERRNTKKTREAPSELIWNRWALGTTVEGEDSTARSGQPGAAVWSGMARCC